MEHVLVVDDSVDQAFMVESILQAEGFETCSAANGAEALSVIEKRPPDIVVTDLMMPEVNGLELVEKLRESHPALPVILMTAYGSGEIAMKALQKGAASYIPKRHVPKQIVETLEQILELSRNRRERERLLVSLLESESRFVMRTDPSLVPPMVNHVTRSIGARVTDVGENELMRLGLALQEALLNALHHGNLELDSEIREASIADYLRLADERAKQAPYCDRQVRLSVRVDPTEITLIVEDDGAGFDTSLVPDPTDQENLLRASGRGLHLIGTIMDQVTHNDCGNRITMVKSNEHQ